MSVKKTNTPILTFVSTLSARAKNQAVDTLLSQDDRAAAEMMSENMNAMLDAFLPDPVASATLKYGYHPNAPENFAIPPDNIRELYTEYELSLIPLRDGGINYMTVGNPSINIAPQHISAKLPIYKNWSKYCNERPTEFEIETWINKHQQANWGIACGKASNLVVIDCDSQSAVSWVEHNLVHTCTRTITSKGKHFWYRIPKNIDKWCAEIAFFKNLDIDLKYNGYVLAPGCLHPDHKTIYKLEEDQSYNWLTEAPELALCEDFVDKNINMTLWPGNENSISQKIVVNKTTTNAKPLKNNSSYIDGKTGKVPNGKRHHALRSYTGTCIARGMSEDMVLDNVIQYNIENIDNSIDPISNDEIRKIVNGLIEKDKQNHPEQYTKKTGPVAAEPKQRRSKMNYENNNTSTLSLLSSPKAEIQAPCAEEVTHDQSADAEVNSATDAANNVTQAETTTEQSIVAVTAAKEASSKEHIIKTADSAHKMDEKTRQFFNDPLFTIKGVTDETGKEQLSIAEEHFQSSKSLEDSIQLLLAECRRLTIFIVDGHINPDDAYDVLEQTALKSGLDSAEISRCLNQGFRQGTQDELECRMARAQKLLPKLLPNAVDDVPREDVKHCEEDDDREFLHVPQLPINALLPGAQHVVQNMAQAFNVDPWIPFFGLLKNTACFMGASYMFNYRNYDAPAHFWGVLIAPTGMKKSKCIGKIFQPVVRENARLEQENIMAFQEYVREYEEWHDEKIQAKKDKAIFDREEPKRPPFQQLYCNDTTTERLAEILRDNPFGIAINSDEIASHISGYDKYRGSKGFDKTLMLSMYTGEEYNKQRVKDITNSNIKTRIPHAWASIFGTCQDEIWPTLISKNDVQRGYGNRYITIFPQKMPLKSITESCPVDDDAINNLFYDMSMWPRPHDLDEYGDVIGRRIELADDALPIYDAFYDALEKENENAGSYAALTVRFTEKLSRLTLLVHLLECSEMGMDYPAQRISVETVKRAKIIFDALKEHLYYGWTIVLRYHELDDAPEEYITDEKVKVFDMVKDFLTESKDGNLVLDYEAKINGTNETVIERIRKSMDYIRSPGALKKSISRVLYKIGFKRLKTNKRNYPGITQRKYKQLLEKLKKD